MAEFTPLILLYAGVIARMHAHTHTGHLFVQSPVSLAGGGGWGLGDGSASGLFRS